MFNRFKERLKGFKESVSTKIQEKGEAQAKKAEAKAAEKAGAKGTTPASGNDAAVVTKTAEAEPLPEKNASGASKTKQSFASRAKSLIFEQEVVLDEKDLQDPLWELEIALLESDVALPVAETIVASVKDELVGRKKKIRADTGEIVEEALRSALHQVLSENRFDVDEFIEKAEKPVKIVFVGVNGTGKTTSIAKVARYLKDRGYSIVLAAGDTFRAGAVEQIEVHANKLEVKLVKHRDGKDPAAVIFDAVERARLFNEAVPIDGTILTKTDADAKGGAAISISSITGKPVLFLGIGQDYPDLVKFEPEWLLERLLGS